MDRATWSGSRAVSWACAVAALAPPLALVVAVDRYHVRVPVWDNWDIVPLLDSTCRGWPDPADLVAQHNEHRPLFPRLAFLVLARLSSWDIRWELAASLVTAGLIYALLLKGAVETQRAAGRRPSPWVWPALSLLVFSLAQWENWLWGWQLQIFMCVAGVLGGLLALGFGGTGHRALALAIACGTLATWSFASGMLFWPVAVLSLLLADEARAARLRSAGLLALVGAANIALYLHGWQHPGHHPELLGALLKPAQLAEYALKFIGSPLAYARAHAAPAGAVGLLLLAYLVARLRADGAHRGGPARAWLAIAAYVVACAVFTGVGRVAIGTDFALRSRYLTFSIPFWVAVLALLLFVARAPRDAAATTRRRRLGPTLFGVLALGLATAHSAGSLTHFRVWYTELDRVRRVIVAGRDTGIAFGLFTHPSQVERGIRIARAGRWSCVPSPPSRDPLAGR